MNICSAIALSVTLISGSAAAADRTEAIHFATGKMSESINGSVHGHDHVTYDISTAEGRKLRVRFTPSSRLCYFDVFEPGNEEATFIGSTSGIEFRVNPTKAGTYKAKVYLLRNLARHKEDCRYQLSVKLTESSGIKKQ